MTAYLLAHLAVDQVVMGSSLHCIELGKIFKIYLNSKIDPA